MEDSDKLLAIVRPVTLKFSDDDIETDFRTYYYQRSLRVIRFSLATGILFFSVFGLYDLATLKGQILSQLLWIRFGLVCPSLIVILLLSYTPHFLKKFEFANQLALLIPGCGILAINYLTKAPNGFIGLILLLIYTYTLSRLRFWQSS